MKSQSNNWTTTDRSVTGKSLSGAVLKNVAILLMFCNHLGTVYFERFPGTAPLLDNLQIYATRASFVLFCFLLAEGMRHTRDRKRYLLRLLAVAVVSEIIYDCTFHGVWLYWGNQNVFFNLFAGGLSICLYDRFKGKEPLQIGTAIAVALVSHILCFDYDFMGVVLPLTFYLCPLGGNSEEEKARNKRRLVLWFVPVMVLSSIGLYALMFVRSGYGLLWRYILAYGMLEAHGLLALPLILRYNGQKGKQLPKGFYYAFYPAHLAAITFFVQVVLQEPLF